MLDRLVEIFLDYRGNVPRRERVEIERVLDRQHDRLLHVVRILIRLGLVHATHGAGSTASGTSRMTSARGPP